MPCSGFCAEIKGGILLALCRINLLVVRKRALSPLGNARDTWADYGLLRFYPNVDASLSARETRALLPLNERAFFLYFSFFYAVRT